MFTGDPRPLFQPYEWTNDTRIDSVGEKETGEKKIENIFAAAASFLRHKSNSVIGSNSTLAAAILICPYDLTVSAAAAKVQDDEWRMHKPHSNQKQSLPNGFTSIDRNSFHFVPLLSSALPPPLLPSSRSLSIAHALSLDTIDFNFLWEIVERSG